MTVQEDNFKGDSMEEQVNAFATDEILPGNFPMNLPVYG
jgi:hypothetical protein